MWPWKHLPRTTHFTVTRSAVYAVNQVTGASASNRFRPTLAPTPVSQQRNPAGPEGGRGRNLVYLKADRTMTLSVRFERIRDQTRGHAVGTCYNSSLLIDPEADKDIDDSLDDLLNDRQAEKKLTACGKPYEWLKTCIRRRRDAKSHTDDETPDY